MKQNNLFAKDVKRFIDGTYTREEAKRIFLHLENRDKDYEKAFAESMSETWEENEDNTLSVFQKKLYREEACRLLGKINKKPLFPAYFIRRSLSIAASILILLATGMGTYKYFPKTELSYTEIQTGFGEMYTVKLPDGTDVTLNVCSKISYPEKFKGNERQIRLEGEAYFKVAKNEKRPFIIKTNQFDVKVLGTEFNVKAYAEDEVQLVDVESGKVQVEMPDASMKLTANEMLRMYENAGEYNKFKDGQAVAVWRKGSLRFDKAPVRDVANELERMYHCKIAFKEGKVFDNIISGEHNNESLEAVLKSLEYTSGIHFRFMEKNRILLFK